MKIILNFPPGAFKDILLPGNEKVMEIIIFALEFHFLKKCLVYLYCTVLVYVDKHILHVIILVHTVQ